jgi:hypothetical protein
VNSYLTPTKYSSITEDVIENSDKNSNIKISNNMYNKSNIKFNKANKVKKINDDSPKFSSTDYIFKKTKNIKKTNQKSSIVNNIIENQKAQNLIQRKKNLGKKIKKLVGNKKKILINNKKKILINNKKIVLSVPKNLRLNRSKLNKLNKKNKENNINSKIIKSKRIIPSNKLSYYKKNSKNTNKYHFYNNNYNKVNNVKLKDGEIIKLDRLDKKGQSKVSKRLKIIDNNLLNNKNIYNGEMIINKKLKKNSYLYHKFPTTPLKNVVKKVTRKVKNKNIKIKKTKKLKSKKSKSNFNSFVNFFKFGK